MGPEQDGPLLQNPLAKRQDQRQVSERSWRVGPRGEEPVSVQEGLDAQGRVLCEDRGKATLGPDVLRGRGWKPETSSESLVN